MILVRPEKPEDYHTIYALNKKAFDGEVESRLVNNLRKTKGFIPELSLVAEKDGKVVGHILFSVVHINTGIDNVPVLALAPMAVLPEYQKQGIGSLLVKEGLSKCKESGNKAVVLVGHSDYYPRFGFIEAGDKGLKLPFDAPKEAFMVYEIIPDSLTGITGTIEYPPEFAEE
ncbi:MAG: N-acetyltransferase [Candidatus Paceibacterota bacterium]|jgi:putative acetyltransferase